MPSPQMDVPDLLNLESKNILDMPEERITALLSALAAAQAWPDGLDVRGLLSRDRPGWGDCAMLIEVWSGPCRTKEWQIPENALVVLVHDGGGHLYKVMPDMDGYRVEASKFLYMT